MPRRVDYSALPTEQPNPRSRGLDRLPVPHILRAMHREDAQVPRAVAKATPQIATAVRRIVEALRRGGRLIFLGAGTSGRLGVIEAAECPPTFNTPPSMVQAIIAGGRPAVFRSREGAEDHRAQARRDVRYRVRRGDVVMGITASGVTPFVEAGLREAKRRGAATILLTCSYRHRVRLPVDAVIACPVGPELITGSTRLKAGTATKLILNRLTVATMVRLGKVQDNLMVDVRPASRKLHARAVRIVQQVADVPARQAQAALQQARGNTKLAIVMAARRMDVTTATQQLKRADGRLSEILRTSPTVHRRESTV